MAENIYLVTKNGMVFDCKTEERYKSFIEDGWVDYYPPGDEDTTSPEDTAKADVKTDGKPKK